MKESKSQTQQVIEHLIENNVDRFTIKEIWKAFPNIKANTISTLVSRDLKKKGLVTKTDARKGMSVIYQFDPNGKPVPKVKKVVTKLRKGAHKKNDSYDSYVKIGMGIEELIESKNTTIQGLNNQLESSKKMILDHEATIQERDRYITEQGNKIHELSEQIRKKSGGAIKLDELQKIVNSNPNESKRTPKRTYIR